MRNIHNANNKQKLAGITMLVTGKSNSKQCITKNSDLS